MLSAEGILLMILNCLAVGPSTQKCVVFIYMWMYVENIVCVESFVQRTFYFELELAATAAAIATGTAVGDPSVRIVQVSISEFQI